MNTILLIISITAIINPFMISSLNIAIIEIEKSFNINSIQTSWIILSYMLTTALSMLPSSKLADIYGKRKIFITGVFLFAISSLLCSFSKNFTQILIFRIVQGIGVGMFLGVGTAILTQVFPKEMRGRVLGINVACVYIGLSIGPFLGGFIVGKTSWRILFLITAIINIFVSILSIYKLKFEDIINKSKFDIKQSLLYSFFILPTIYGFSKLNTINGIYITIIGIIFSIIFIKTEEKSHFPLIGLKKFKDNIVFIYSNLAALINYMATSVITFFISIYLQTVKQIPPQKTGIILLTQPILMSIISPFAGKHSDKKEPQKIASTGMIFTTISLIMISFITEKTTISYIIITLMIAGIGFGLFSSPNTNAVMSSVNKSDFSKASAILGTSRVIGQAMSMGLSTLIISIYLSNQSLNQNPLLFLKSMKISFILFSILSFMGIYFSLKRGKIHKT